MALLDGLEDRGSVVVIGATNRPDAVDPALRRPGRFDRELRFDLPDREARDTILRIHTRNWRVPLADDLREWLAENTPNFCGADLGLLCSEAALAAVKTRFPQLLSENVALQFDPTKVEVDKLHWQLALQAVVPAAQKNAANHARKLSRPEAVLLEEDERLIVAQVRSMFPPMLRGNLLPGVNFVDNTLTVDTREPPPVYRPRLLVNGPANCGQVRSLIVFPRMSRKVNIIFFSNNCVAPRCTLWQRTECELLPLLSPTFSHRRFRPNPQFPLFSTKFRALAEPLFCIWET